MNEDLALLEKEEHIRELFECTELPDEVSATYFNLINVFEKPELFYSSDEDESMAKVLCQQREVISGPYVLRNDKPHCNPLTVLSTLVSRPEFLENWQKLTQGMLEGLGTLEQFTFPPSTPEVQLRFSPFRCQKSVTLFYFSMPVEVQFYFSFFSILFMTWVSCLTVGLEGLLTSCEDWQNVFIAGGAVLSAVLPQNQGFGGTDLDIFLVDLDHEVGKLSSLKSDTPQSDQIQEKLRHIVEVVCMNTGASGKVRYT